MTNIHTQIDLTWCVAVGVRVGGRISRSMSSDKASPPGGCVNAAPGTRHWRMTWCSEDICEAWPPCVTWSESACLTWKRKSVDTLYTCGGKQTHTRPQVKTHAKHQRLVSVFRHTALHVKIGKV